MGNDYSRIQGSQFPVGYFCIGFRQPDFIQIIHAPAEIVNLIKQVVAYNWAPGIRAEKRYSLGVELKLHHDPFSNDCNNMERVANCFKLVCTLLHALITNGCCLVTNGHYIRGIERNIWIMTHEGPIFPVSHPYSEVWDENNTSGLQVSAIALEDWNKIMVISNSSEVAFAVQNTVEVNWPLGIKKTNVIGADIACMELGGQPWDSYKAEADKSPLLILKIIETMGKLSFRLLCCSHVRGNIDTLFFIEDPLFTSAGNKYLVMSLSQQDQIRLYMAPSNVVNKVSAFTKSKWEKGYLTEEISGPMWVQRLKGSPWWRPDWDKDAAMSARNLITALIAEMRYLGWMVTLSMDIYRSQYDKSLILFECTMHTATLPHFCIATHESDRLMISCAPAEVQTIMRTDIPNHWQHPLKEDTNIEGYLEYSLEKKPWVWDYENCACNMEGLGLICWIHSLLDNSGWNVVTSLDISSNTKYSPHTWIVALRDNDTPRPVAIKHSAKQ